MAAKILRHNLIIENMKYIINTDEVEISKTEDYRSYDLFIALAAKKSHMAYM